MSSTNNALSEKIRAQSVELSSLADAIDLYARLQQTRLIASAGSSLLATHELFDKNSAPVEDYSDLLPNAPPDPTSWRGEQFRQMQNAPAHSAQNPPNSALLSRRRTVSE